MAKTKEINPTGIDLNRNWGWILGLGILFVILGCIGLGMVVGLTLVSMIFFAALLIVAGITHVVDVFKHREWKGIIWQSLIAILYIVAGCVVFYDPFLASTLITAALAGVLIVIGLTRILMAFSLKDSKGWLWLLLAGITAIILGMLILMHWPISGLWVIGLFIAIEMIVTGWTYIFIAFASRT
ncbi:membrane protein [Legionella antarctica]|uniref:Membrane protein n=1 Tax=Legionella antarctica TaxID=2708020 RepID=A0A6F8T9K0_9GAMM|nr:HdeD family acid-resistance protein [Legionella antarctica]BCA96840.1 membrane protein [Legionella antarctica]